MSSCTGKAAGSNSKMFSIFQAGILRLTIEKMIGVGGNKRSHIVDFAVPAETFHPQYFPCGETTITHQSSAGKVIAVVRFAAT